jgi:capsular polysaccharide biosynthesis protein
MYKNELEIDVIRCIKALGIRKKFIGLITFIFLIIGIGLSLNVGQDKYSAKATAYAAADKSYSDSANAVTAMNAYLDVAKSYKVCQRAALILGRTDIDAIDIQNSVKVTTSAKTSSSSTVSNFMNSSATIVTFTASTTDPELSMEMADAMVQSYVREMADILHADSVKMLDKAHTYKLSYNTKREIAKRIIKVGMAGFAIACLVVLSCEIFDTKVRTVREATIGDKLPVIGIIPDYKE